MTRLPKYSIIALCVASLFISCDTTPEHVMTQEEMAQYLADIYTAESIVDINRSDYRDDSSKMALKQSVMLRHGVSQEMVDTSFEWYGHHIEDYIEVHDRVIEILENSIASASTTNNIFGVVGDSVDTWQYDSHIAFTELTPSHVINFELPKDDNWEKGDVYTWAIKFTNNRNPIKWGISMEYSSGKMEYIYGSINDEGWNRLKLVSDSTQIPNRISGYLVTDDNNGQNIYLDSISLMRYRKTPDSYSSRYRQRLIELTPKIK